MDSFESLHAALRHTNERVAQLADRVATLELDAAPVPRPPTDKVSVVMEFAEGSALVRALKAFNTRLELMDALPERWGAATPTFTGEDADAQPIFDALMLAYDLGRSEHTAKLHDDQSEVPSSAENVARGAGPHEPGRSPEGAPFPRDGSASARRGADEQHTASPALQCVRPGCREPVELRELDCHYWRIECECGLETTMSLSREIALEIWHKNTGEGRATGEVECSGVRTPGPESRSEGSIDRAAPENTGFDSQPLPSPASPAIQPCDSCSLAWGLIANAYGGDWERAHADWREAAERWRDAWLRGPHKHTAPADVATFAPLPAPQPDREEVERIDAMRAVVEPIFSPQPDRASQGGTPTVEEVVTHYDWTFSHSTADGSREKCKHALSAVRSLMLARRAPEAGALCKWEADHQREALISVDPALAEEFPFGCDSIEHVAVSLLAARAKAKPSPSLAALVEACERWAGCDGCDLIEMHRAGKLSDSGYSDSVKRLVPLIVEARAALDGKASRNG